MLGVVDGEVVGWCFFGHGVFVVVPGSVGTEVGIDVDLCGHGFFECVGDGGVFHAGAALCAWAAGLAVAA
jgi:hypothetical protein